MTAQPIHPLLIPDVAMTVTFVSEHKHFGFAARHDTGESCYISPMLAEQIGLDRTSAGRELAGTLAANSDDHGGQATSGTPWRVMSWSAAASGQRRAAAADDTRRDLEDVLRHVERLRSRIETALTRLA